MHAEKVREHISSRRNMKERQEEQDPYAGKTQPTATLYGANCTSALAKWLRGLEERQDKPTSEQLEFLQAVVERLSAEAHAEQKAVPVAAEGEPLFDLIHGVPGAGKSKIIRWLQACVIDTTVMRNEYKS